MDPVNHGSTTQNGHVNARSTVFSLTGTRWASYLKSRPEYPASLTKLIYNYRREHGNAEWSRIVDIGAGAGIALVNFGADFKILHVSDPSPSNLESAEAFLTQWTTEQGLDVKLEYSQCSGEETHKHVGEGQADMVICATAAQYIDRDGLIACIAKLLRPGGTMAVFLYWTPYFPRQSDEFNAAYGWIFGATIEHSFDPKNEVASTIVARALRQVRSGIGGLDYLPIPDAYFRDKQRVRINASKGEMLFGDWMDNLPGSDTPLSPRITPNDKEISFETGTDAEGEGWGFMVDKDFLYGYLRSMLTRATLLEDIMQSMPERFAEFERVWEKEAPTGSVWIQFPVGLNLGTRK